MNENSSNQLSFWQELKRRKVIRVIIGYAAASFVILELTSMITDPFSLPEWTFRLVFVLLAIGLVITAILSWVYDLTPGGIQKTRPASIQPEKKGGSGGKKFRLKASDVVIGILLIAVLVLLYPKIFVSKSVQKLRTKGEVSIAVMPFQNLTNNPEKDFWRIMMQDNLITYLSNSEVLKVRQAESTIQLLEEQKFTSQSPLTPELAGEVSRKLNAQIFILGSVGQVAGTIRLNAKLLDTETQEVFKAFLLEAPENSILTLADSLSLLVHDYLVTTLLKKNVEPDINRYLGSASSPESMEKYINGMKAFFNRDYVSARSLFQQAIEIDSAFVAPMASLAFSYGNTGEYLEAKEWSLRAYQKREHLSRMDQLMVERSYAAYWGTPYDMINVLKQTIELDDQKAAAYFQLGLEYAKLNQFEEAASYYEKSLDIYDQWGIDPIWVYNYTGLGRVYHELGEYGKEERLYREAEKCFPDDYSLVYRQAILALSLNKSSEAEQFLNRYETLLREETFEEYRIKFQLGSIHRLAGINSAAEKYYHESLALDPGNPDIMNGIADFLWETGQQTGEALELVNRALEQEPDNYRYLATKGRLMHKMQQDLQALKFLEKSWELKPVYNHEIYLDLQSLRKNAGN